MQREWLGRGNGWAVALLVAAGSVAALLGSGCGSAKQSDYRELREYALDESVPLDSRSETLLAVAQSDEESTHLRAVAVQMLGVLQVEQAQPTMLRILGHAPEEDAEPNRRNPEGDAEDADAATDPAWLLPEPEVRPAASELLRMEAVMALGRFAEPELYDAVLRLIYEDRRDRSEMVLRQYVQSFAHAEAFDHPDAAASAEVLLRWLRLALDRNEDESLVRTALHELRRLAQRPDLNANEIPEWQEQIAQMRLGRARPGATPDTE